MRGKAVDWDKVGRLCGEVDLDALQRGASLLFAAGYRKEYAAATDAVSTLSRLRSLAERRGDVPWSPPPRIVRDEMKRDRGDR